MRSTSLLFSIIFLLAGHISLSQESISLNVIYEFTYVRDLANKDIPYSANMVLSVGKHGSRYCPEKLYNEHDRNAEAARKKQQELQSASARPMMVVSGGPLLLVNKYGAIINEEIVKDIPGRQLIQYAVMGIKSYRVETALPAINWTIQHEKKTIDKYTCQKAIGSYGGRTYEAWFTPDLPFQDGPWKLSGLPGLILEAQDTAHEVSFIFKELSRNTDAEATTQSFLNSEYSIKANLKDYIRAKAAFETDPESITAAQAPNARLAVKNIDEPGGQHAPRIRKYNLLEHGD